MSGGAENRTAKRVSYLCEAQVTGVGTRAVNPRLNDISATGAFIDTMTALPEGTLLSVSFELEGTPIVVEAEVVHSMPQIGMGIRFVELDPDHQELISKLAHAAD